MPDFLPGPPIFAMVTGRCGIPADLQDRRVEITGPVERKMVINALNANVKVFMADFEDSLAPAWNKVIGPDQPARCGQRHHCLPEPGGRPIP